MFPNKRVRATPYIESDEEKAPPRLRRVPVMTPEVIDEGMELQSLHAALPTPRFTVEEVFGEIQALLADHHTQGASSPPDGA